SSKATKDRSSAPISSETFTSIRSSSRSSSAATSSSPDEGTEHFDDRLHTARTPLPAPGHQRGAHWLVDLAGFAAKTAAHAGAPHRLVRLGHGLSDLAFLTAAPSDAFPDRAACTCRFLPLGGA